MNKTATTIIIILVIAIGAWLLLKNKDAAPMDDMTMPTSIDQNPQTPSDTNTNTNTNTSTSTNTNTNTNNPDSSLVGGDASVDVSIKSQTRSFTVDSTNYKFAPATMTVNKGDTVRITLKNTQGNHDLKVDGYDIKTKILTAPGEDTIEFKADKTGTFEYYCTIGNHRAMGMKGTLTVK